MTSPSRRDLPPRIRAVPPGAGSRRLAERLRAVESRNVTFLADDFPIFWEKARGSNVWDADGNRLVDLTAGFGVAAAGHRNPAVVSAIRRQIARLAHGMGDVHPPGIKVRLLERLASLSPWSETRTVLTCSGAEAVEVAIKTARLRSGKPGVVAFTGAYHGLTYGALALTDRALFRSPFEAQLNPHVLRAPYPDPYRPPVSLAERGGPVGRAALDALGELLDTPAGRQVGAVVIEPIQGRGGDVVPPDGFLGGLGRLCAERGILLVADEIYTGLGRSGAWFACESEGVVPDLICVGKGLSGALPIAACIGSADAMDAWPESDGEAIHTSTFLGNPVACAAALASLREIERSKLPRRAREEGARWLDRLREMGRAHWLVGDVRGRGLMIGLDLVRDPETREPAPDFARRVLKGALRRGWIVLAGGPSGNVISLSPPLCVDRAILDLGVTVLDELLTECAEDRQPR